MTNILVMQIYFDLKPGCYVQGMKEGNSAPRTALPAIAFA